MDLSHQGLQQNVADWQDCNAALEDRATRRTRPKPRGGGHTARAAPIGRRIAFVSFVVLARCPYLLAALKR
ncbi:MAG TPA: hypothetical protein VFC46_04355 [Humisphaera sp.]|nr:hypothetical protein [Humisphaera sp.]